MIKVIWNHVVFEETAVGICDALFLGGFDAESSRVNFENDFENDVLYVVLGLHRFGRVPKRFIAVQAEQVGSKWMKTPYLANLRRALCVWDFSFKNCQYFQQKGIWCCHVRSRVPMEIFHPGSSSVELHFSTRQKDIDVLFYGARCRRRESLQSEFLTKYPRLKVVFRFNDLFREEREDLISRSKVVLNIHYWPSASLETHRVEYLCSRGKCVVSEKSSDADLDSEYSGCVSLVPYRSILRTAHYYITQTQERQALESKSQQKCFATQTDTSVIERCVKRCQSGAEPTSNGAEPS